MAERNDGWPFNQLNIGGGAIIPREIDGKVCVLMGQRFTPNGYMEWAFPGGKVEDGETVFEGISREVLEEAGIKVKQFGKIVKIMFDQEGDYLGFGILAEADGEPSAPNPDEIGNWKFFPIDQLPEPLFKYARESLECLAAGSIQIRRTSLTTVS